jgi:Flp pilus assembly protein TadD
MLLEPVNARRGLTADAETEYRAALRLSPQYAPAAVNLADLYGHLRKEGEGESVLRTTLALAPDDAGLHYALGLVLVRLKRQDEALEESRRAAELEPDQTRYAYVYAVGLQSAGREAEAIAALKENLGRHPSDRDTLLALISFSRDAGDVPTALEYAEQLARIEPTNRELATLVETLRFQLKAHRQ